MYAWRRIYLQVMWKFLEQASFHLDEGQYQAQLDAVAEYLTMWRAGETARAGIRTAATKGPGYTGGGGARAVSASIPLCLLSSKQRCEHLLLLALPKQSDVWLSLLPRSPSRSTWMWMADAAGSGTAFERRDACALLVVLVVYTISFTSVEPMECTMYTVLAPQAWCNL